MKSLFGYLAQRFSTQTENLATEALNYVLKNSVSAREGFQKFVSQIDLRINEKLFFRTQVFGDDGAIPDLIGFNEENRPICIVEAKFWAGLTENQPLTYLQRLPKNLPSVLLFLVPRKRMESMWGELLIRLDEGKSDITDIRKTSEIVKGKLNDHNSLAITNWDALLNVISTELDLAGDIISKSDLVQLQGLCSQMDSEAFLPIRAEEISPDIARLNLQFAEIVDDTISRAVAMGLCSTKGLRAVGGSDYYIRYFSMEGVPCCLGVHYSRWRKFFNTPLWLAVYGRKWKDFNKVKRALFELEMNVPKRLFVEDNGLPVVPIKLETGVEKENVVSSVISQLKDIGDILQRNYIPDVSEGTVEDEIEDQNFDELTS